MLGDEDDLRHRIDPDRGHDPRAQAAAGEVTDSNAADSALSVVDLVRRRRAYRPQPPNDPTGDDAA